MGRQLRALLLLSPLMILGCDGLPESSSEVITERDLVEETAEFASRYDAETDWGEIFRDRDYFKEIYTFEIQTALLRTDSRPLLILATLEDITKDNDTYFLHFSTLATEQFSFLMPELHLVLEADKSLIDTVTSRADRFVDEYAVIATISSVSKPTRVTDEGSNFLFVQGLCVDLMLHDFWGVEN